MKTFLYLRYLILSLFVISFDRISKLYAYNFFHEKYSINKFLNFELVINRGVSWGIFNSSNNNIFYILTSFIIAITLFLGIYTYLRMRNNFLIFGEILVLAGSLSNIIDRFIYKGVIDFISLNFIVLDFAIFNIADAAIVIGVILMFIQSFFEK